MFYTNKRLPNKFFQVW